MIKKFFCSLLIFFTMIFFITSTSFAGSDEEYYIYLMQQQYATSCANAIYKRLYRSQSLSSATNSLFSDFGSYSYQYALCYPGESSATGYYIFLYGNSYSSTGDYSYICNPGAENQWTITTTCYTVTCKVYRMTANGYISLFNEAQSLNVPAVIYKNIPSDFTDLYKLYQNDWNITDDDDVVSAINTTNTKIDTTNQELSDLNDFLSEEVDDDTEVSVDDYEVSDNPYSAGLSSIFSSITGAMNVSSQDCSFTLLGHEITLYYNSVENGLKTAGFSFLVTLAQSFWLCLVSIIIVRDVMDYYQKLSEGRLEQADTSSVETRLL